MPYLIQKQTDGSTVKQWDLRDKPLTVVGTRWTRESTTTKCRGNIL
jgi:hypothetical protein